MTSRPDFIVVDDTSTAQPEQIKYLPGWTQFNLADNIGISGPPLYQSLHVATSHTGFSFTYNGAAGPLSIMGSMLNNSLPVWNCTIDNKPLVSISNGEVQSIQHSNHIEICSSTSQTTPVGDHTIRVSVAASEDSPAWFDYILYTPAPKVRAGDLLFESNNVGIQYGSNWQSDGNGGMITSSAGETLDFDFNGHTVSWIGFYDGSLGGREQSAATYSIDGGNPVDFTIENSANGSAVLSEQVFFQTPSQQQVGQHHLQVIYRGVTGSTPLTLTHLIIQNSTSDFHLTPIPAGTAIDPAITPLSIGASVSPSSSSSRQFSTVKGTSTVSISTSRQSTTTLEFRPSISPHNTATPVPKKRLHSGDVAGISIAILVLVCIAIFLACRTSRRRRKVAQTVSERARPFSHSDRPPPVPEKGHVQQPSATTFSDIERQSQSIFNPRPSKARRLAEATASALRLYRTRSTDLTNTIQSPLSGRPSRIVMHQDSGVQLRQPDEEVEIIEVPPAYATIK